MDYQFEMCDTRFRSMRSKFRHVQNYHRPRRNNGEQSCPICKYPFSRPDNLLCHQRTFNHYIDGPTQHTLNHQSQDEETVDLTVNTSSEDDADIDVGEIEYKSGNQATNASQHHQQQNYLDSEIIDLTNNSSPGEDDEIEYITVWPPTPQPQRQRAAKSRGGDLSIARIGQPVINDGASTSTTYVSSRAQNGPADNNNSRNDGGVDEVNVDAPTAATAVSIDNVEIENER